MVNDNWKSNAWAELTAKWAEYKKGELELKTREQLAHLEPQIIQLQKDLNVYDKPDQFEIRWSNRKPPQPEAVKNANNSLDENTKSLLIKFADEAIAKECFLADYYLKKNPSLSQNPAKLGQLINLAINEYNLRLNK